MSEEKQDRGTEPRKRTIAFCGRCMAVVSVAVLVRVVQKVRRQRLEQQQAQHHHRRFPLLGH
jgi:hypothetical protein